MRISSYDFVNPVTEQAMSTVRAVNRRACGYNADLVVGNAPYRVTLHDPNRPKASYYYDFRVRQHGAFTND